MNPSTGCSPEARARTARMVFEYRLEHGARWAAIRIDVRDLIHTVGLTARFGRYEGAGLVAVGTRR